MGNDPTDWLPKLPNYQIGWLPNGLVRVFCRSSKLRGLYTPKGEWHCGDLRLPAEVVRALLARLAS